MNSLILIPVAAVLFWLGYRYFARFLTVSLRPSSPEYSTEGESATDEHAWFWGVFVPDIDHGLPLAVAAMAVLASAGWSAGFVWLLVGGLLWAAAFSIAVLRLPVAPGLDAPVTAWVAGISAWLFGAVFSTWPSVATAILIELAVLYFLTMLPRYRYPAALVGALVAALLGHEFPLTASGDLHLALARSGLDVGGPALFGALAAALALRPPRARDTEQQTVLTHWLVLALAVLVTLVYRHPTLPQPAAPANGALTPALLALAFAGLPFLPTRPDAPVAHAKAPARFKVTLILLGFLLLTFLLVSAFGFAGQSLDIGATARAVCAGWSLSPNSVLGTFLGSGLLLALFRLLSQSLARTRVALAQRPWPSLIRGHTDHPGAALWAVLVLLWLVSRWPVVLWGLFNAVTLALVAVVLWRTATREALLLRLLAVATGVLALWAVVAGVFTQTHPQAWLVLVALAALGLAPGFAALTRET